MEGEPGAPRCQNCEQPVVGEYCSACGQRNLDHRRPLFALLHELATEMLELDGRLRRTLLPFFARPGFLTREFRAGRRVRYTSPLRLYIATSLLCFSMIALKACIGAPGEGEAPVVQLPPEHVFDADDDLEAGSFQAQLDERMRGFSELPPEEGRKRILNGLSANMPKALLLLVPVFAGIVGLLTMRRGFLYVDHLVFALHVHSFWFAVLALATFTPGFLGTPLRLVMFAYGLIAFKRTYELGWGAAVWRVIVGSLLYGIALMIALLAAILATIVWG